ncbi:MAG: hypothetical protein ACHQ9S_23035 [Candidatus Binatia bacterium]
MEKLLAYSRNSLPGSNLAALGYSPMSDAAAIVACTLRAEWQTTRDPRQLAASAQRLGIVPNITTAAAVAYLIHVWSWYASPDSTLGRRMSIADQIRLERQLRLSFKELSLAPVVPPPAPPPSATAPVDQLLAENTLACSGSASTLCSHSLGTILFSNNLGTQFVPPLPGSPGATLR